MPNLTYAIVESAMAYLLGTILILSGIRAVFKQQIVVSDEGAVLDIKFPFWHLKTRSAALALVAMGMLLIATPTVINQYFRPQKLRVAGRILYHDGQTVLGLQNAVVGILPSHTHTVATAPDGRYYLDVPKGVDGETYQAVVHVSNINPPFFIIGVVDFTSDGGGRFDHTFQGRSTQ